MHVLLPPELEQFVETTVKSGQYQDASAMITHALKSLWLNQQLSPRGADLQRLIAEGQASVDRGDVRDGEEAFREILARNAARNSPK